MNGLSKTHGFAIPTDENRLYETGPANETISHGTGFPRPVHSLRELAKKLYNVAVMSAEVSS
jgi:hypothetical protein